MNVFKYTYVLLVSQPKQHFNALIVAFLFECEVLLSLAFYVKYFVLH